MGTIITREKLLRLILNLLERHFEESNETIDLKDGELTKLFGGDGVLDSLGLVGFIVEVEEALEDELGISILLADEKALSRRTSPFSRVSYLVDYILEILK
jgi:hypothetical protein